jgi:hypothetical protein
MNEASSVPGDGKHSRPWAWLVLSVVLFGLLMGFRGEVHSIWLRALVAGIAFAVLYPSIQGFRHKP